MVSITRDCNVIWQARTMRRYERTRRHTQHGTHIAVVRRREDGDHTRNLRLRVLHGHLVALRLGLVRANDAGQLVLLQKGLDGVDTT